MRKLTEFFRDNRVIRERDAQGRLIAAGFGWLEPVEVIQIPFALGALALFFCACAAASSAAPREAAIMFGIAALACVVIVVLFGSIDRGIAFTQDGRVSVRGGWINRLELLRTVKEHAAIASIETIRTHRGSGVVVLTSWGGTFIFADGLEEPAARLVAVQLTIALRELRDSLTSIQNFQRPHAAATGPARSQAWID